MSGRELLCVTITFAGGLSAADACSMCAEHVLGAVLSGILMKPDYIIREHNEE